MVVIPIISQRPFLVGPTWRMRPAFLRNALATHPQIVYPFPTASPSPSPPAAPSSSRTVPANTPPLPTCGRTPPRGSVFHSRTGACVGAWGLIGSISAFGSRLANRNYPALSGFVAQIVPPCIDSTKAWTSASCAGWRRITA